MRTVSLVKMPALFLAEKDLDRHSLEVPSFADLILQKTAVPLFNVLRQVDEKRKRERRAANRAKGRAERKAKKQSF